MIPFIKENKILTFVVTVFVFAVLYFAVFANKNDAPLLSSDTATPIVGSQELLMVLSNLRTIQLNTAIFTDPVFLSLYDFGVTLIPQSTGRHNPFDKILVTSVVPKDQTDVQIPKTKLIPMQVVHGH